MNEVGSTTADEAAPRPARSYRQLARQILGLATRPISDRRFLRDLAKLVAHYTACDRVELELMGDCGYSGAWVFDAEGGELSAPGEQVPAARPAAAGSSLQLGLQFGDERLGRLALHSCQPDFFSQAKRELYEDLAHQLAVALSHHSTQHQQRERVKELDCLYRIALIAGQPELSIQQALEQLLALLPPAWQYPDISEARIRVAEHACQTPGFDGVVEQQSAAVRVGGRPAGEVVVGYRQARPRLDEGPFLREERHLLDAVAREITQVVERKQAEAERWALQEQLQHADRLATIGQLAAGVAHELNEPLGSILGFAQLAQRSAGLDGQVLRDLGRIESAALHSREIVRKLNLFARQAPASRCQVQLNAVIRESMLFLESRCAKEGIRVELALAPDLPEVYADAGQLMQVLVNLVVNAIQAMPAGGRLDVATQARPQAIELAVADCGQGIAPDVVERIFEPFFTTKDVGQGTGLGLSVVHGIVAAHGGQIEVDSQPGGGTRFTVQLPLEEPDARDVDR